MSSHLSRSRLVAGTVVLALIGLWIGTGSFVLAVMVLVLVGGVAGLVVLAASGRLGGRALRPRPQVTPAPDATPTTDLSLAPRPGAAVRRALRGVLARPWVRGEGLIRAAASRLASEDALVWTPRGQRVAAPHLWLEWNVSDAAEIAERWPLETLAREMVQDYVERTRADGTRRLADHTWLHVLARSDVPVGRVVVTAAFSAPQDPVLAAAAAPSSAPPVPPAPGRRFPGRWAAATPRSRHASEDRYPTRSPTLVEGRSTRSPYRGHR